MKPDQLSTDQVKALAVAHIRRLEHLVTASSGRVNHAECERRLAIWKGALSKARHSPQWRLLLSDAEKKEIQGAVESGDFEDLLRVTGERPS